MGLNRSFPLNLKILRWILYGCVSVVGYLALVRVGFLFPLQLFPEVLCLNTCEMPQSFHPETWSDGVLINETIENDRLSNNDLMHDQAIASLLPSYFDRNKVTVLIEKSEHRLIVFYDQRPIKSYPVVFGSNPVGDKRNEGDRKTPEGIFHIRDLYPHPAWSKFLWLDYPNPQSWREHFQAKASGELNWLLPIGGEVGIHGVPNNNNDLIDDQTNWTWGCPSMKNEDVDELYSVVQVGTLVEIVP